MMNHNSLFIVALHIMESFVYIMRYMIQLCIANAVNPVLALHMPAAVTWWPGWMTRPDLWHPTQDALCRNANAATLSAFIGKPRFAGWRAVLTPVTSLRVTPASSSRDTTKPKKGNTHDHS